MKRGPVEIGPFPSVRGAIRAPVVWDGKNRRHVEVRISTADYGLLLGRRWRLDKNGYVVAHYFSAAIGKSTSVALHRLIAQAREGDQVDHKRHNLLDCRRCALRRATPSQNSANTRRLHLVNKTSRFRGVTLHRQSGRWQAGYKHRDRFHHLGLFDSQEDAAAAYNRAAAAVWGEFAIVNKLPAQKRDAQVRAA